MHQAIDDLRSLVGLPRVSGTTQAEAQPQEPKTPSLLPFQNSKIFGGGAGMQLMARKREDSVPGKMEPAKSPNMKSSSHLQEQFQASGQTSQSHYETFYISGDSAPRTLRARRKEAPPRISLEGLFPPTGGASGPLPSHVGSSNLTSTDQQGSSSRGLPIRESDMVINQPPSSAQAAKANPGLNPIETAEMSGARKRERSKSPEGGNGSPPAKRERVAELGRKVMQAATTPVRRSQRLIAQRIRPPAITDQPAKREEAGENRTEAKVKKALKRVMPAKKG